MLIYYMHTKALWRSVVFKGIKRILGPKFLRTTDLAEKQALHRQLQYIMSSVVELNSGFSENIVREVAPGLRES